MNIEQQEHRICEIIRAVCERNDVGVTFSTEPASATGATVVCATYDLGREQRRVKKQRAIGLVATAILSIAAVAISTFYQHWGMIVVGGICGGLFGHCCQVSLRGALPPPVSRHTLDQQIAYALSAEGHSVIQGAGKTEIYFPEES